MRYSNSSPFERAHRVYRTAILGVQLLTKGDARFILVGLDGMESYTLGPYPSNLSISDALAIVATDVRLDNKFGGQFDDPFKEPRHGR